MNTVDNYTTIMYAGGKYLAVYLPNHPDALADGYVYEHRIVASKMLGRVLKSNEYVHHKDENGLNNSPDNLMIFASNADHVAFHFGAEIYEKDGVFYAKEFISKKDYFCVDCKAKILYKSTRCRKCQSIYKMKNISRRPSKEELKELLQTYSFVGIGKKYGVSDSAVRKWCKFYGLPYKAASIKLLSKQDWNNL